MATIRRRGGGDVTCTQFPGNVGNAEALPEELDNEHSGFGVHGDGPAESAALGLFKD